MSVSELEARLCRSLRNALAPVRVGEEIGESEQLSKVLTAFEFFLPQVLAEIHTQWRYEAFDGFWLALTQKTGTFGAEFAGLCILISSQTLTPFHLRLEIAESGDEVSSLECRVGENRNGEMIRFRYDSSEAHRELRLLRKRLEDGEIDWTYVVGFGECAGGVKRITDSDT